MRMTASQIAYMCAANAARWLARSPKSQVQQDIADYAYDLSEMWASVAAILGDSPR